jgi:hypothetical protein
LFEVSMEHKEVSVEHKKEAFDAHGFLDLLGEVMDHDVTGVLNSPAGQASLCQSTSPRERPLISATGTGWERDPKPAIVQV